MGYAVIESWQPKLTSIRCARCALLREVAYANDVQAKKPRLETSGAALTAVEAILREMETTP